MELLPVHRPLGLATQPSLSQTINGATQARITTPSQDTAAPLPAARPNDTATGNTDTTTDQQQEWDKISVLVTGGGEDAVQSAIEAKMMRDDDLARTIAETHGKEALRDRWIKVLTDVLGKPGQAAGSNDRTAETFAQFKSGSVGAPI